MAPAPEASATLLYGVFTPECFDAYFTRFDFLQVECGKAVVSKVLGYLIIVGSFILKLPQILKIVAAGNVAGLSPSSFYLEVVTFLASVIYNVIRGYPISTWGESAVILVQNVLLVVLLWYYSSAPKTTQLLGVVTFVGLGAGMYHLPSEFDWVLPSASIPLSVAARIPQIISNFRQGHTGQLAFLTLFLNFGGSAARLFTTLQETGDQVVLLGFAISMLLNGTLLTQILIYWKATDAVLAKEAQKKKH
ncbi:Mannose-P-dolichol utilization defect 1 protein [Aphanomyces cochlioides]|nr:Mannose-P-dolichol utilization defect 1 protein [Aphanomyces cochlioides]